MAVPLRPWVPGIAARTILHPAGVVVLTATQVAVPLTRPSRDARVATTRAVPSAVLLPAVAATAVVVALPRAGPGARPSGRVTPAAAVGVARLLPVAMAPVPALACGGAPALPSTMGASLAEVAAVKPATVPLATPVTASVPIPAVPSAVVAPSQEAGPRPRPRVASIQEAIPDGEGHEALAAARGPSPRPSREVGEAPKLLEVGLP